MDKKYSQNDEERVILRHAPQHGRLLDIGAWSATTFSNSRALIERGWNAVLVEPSPVPFCGLMQEYGTNGRIDLINALAGEEYRLVKFHCSPDAISTTETENLEKWASKGQFTEIWMSEVPISSIATSKFDFISIDTEGTSFSLLKKLDECGAIGDLVCVEKDNNDDAIWEWSVARGFDVIYTSSENMILKRRKSGMS